LDRDLQDVRQQKTREADGAKAGVTRRASGVPVNKRQLHLAKHIVGHMLGTQRHQASVQLQTPSRGCNRCIGTLRMSDCRNEWKLRVGTTRATAEQVRHLPMAAAGCTHVLVVQHRRNHCAMAQRGQYSSVMSTNKAS
jgi:hypothetical protein